MNARLRALGWPALCTAAAAVLLVSLGAWQLRRLSWKEALIARLETRARAEPGALPPRSQWPGLRADDYEYRHVRAAGRFDLDREALIFSKPPAGGGPEPGYLVLTPFVLDDGGVVLVDRGFLPSSKTGTDLRRREPAGAVTIAGLLRAPQARNAFTPADAPEKGVWYTSDPLKIAASLQIADAAPFSIDLDAPAAPTRGADGLPRPSPVDAEISNNHLAYAVTWFGLAVAVAGVFAVYAYGALKRV
ncbi:MAG: SURF1 family protein [Methylocystis sp.]|nr:SURF1 family protein [Methylocystis sp.]MBI3274475.1 SURF1 family protein [Methylocystis sp.]